MRNGKFDCVLMNPPYSGSLHLRFLEKAIRVSEKCVSIQPVRWLQDSLAKYKRSSDYKKYENSISKHIKDIEFIDTHTIEELFKENIHINMQLGIYVCDNNGGYQYDKANILFEKIIKQIDTSFADVIENKEPDNGVILSKLIGGNGGRTERAIGQFDGADNEKFIYRNGKRLDNGLSFYENKIKAAWGNVKPRKETIFISFNTLEECYNFIAYNKLYLIRYLIKMETSDVVIHYKFLPFMDDYTHPWTDEMLYKKFNITSDEQKEIEKLVDYYIELNKKVDKNWRRQI